MHHTARLRFARRGLLSVLMLLVATGSAAANYYELLRRVPDSTNTLILIDAERMLMSPIAMRRSGATRPTRPNGRHSTFRSTRSAICSRRSSTSSRISRISGMSR